MPRKKQEDVVNEPVAYTCPRCLHETMKRSNMKAHFNRQKVCQAKQNNNAVELTPEIIEYVLNNRIYHVPIKASNPPKDNKTIIVNNFNQINNINNIIAGLDVVDKLEKYISYTGNELVDLETTIEEKFQKTVHRLDTDYFDSYFLKEDNLLQMVGKASEPFKNDKEPLRTHNVIYDGKLKELKIFDGGWESMSLELGSKHYLERIQRNFLDSYEKYLIRNIHNMEESQRKNKFREILNEYFMFIGCLGMHPYCEDAVDSEILHPIDADDSDTESVDSITRLGVEGENETRELYEEYYPKYKAIVKSLTNSQKNKIIRQVQDILKRNSTKNNQELNKKITKLFSMEETFREILLTLM